MTGIDETIGAPRAPSRLRESPPPLLVARALPKWYGSMTALDSLDLAILPGEVFCLLGANGAGKTTTINLFLNFIAPTSGLARIDGMDVVEHPLETQQRLAYI